MKKCFVITGIICAVAMLWSCHSVSDRQSDTSTKLDSSRPVAVETENAVAPADETAEQTTNPFSFSVTVAGAAGIINSPGTDPYAEFSAEYETDKWGIGIEGTVHLQQP